jgi:hypothetical protein
MPKVFTTEESQEEEGTGESLREIDRGGGLEKVGCQIAHAAA